MTDFVKISLFKGRYTVIQTIWHVELLDQFKGTLYDNL